MIIYNFRIIYNFTVEMLDGQATLKQVNFIDANIKRKRKKRKSSLVRPDLLWFWFLVSISGFEVGFGFRCSQYYDYDVSSGLLPQKSCDTAYPLWRSRFRPRVCTAEVTYCATYFVGAVGVKDGEEEACVGVGR